MDKLTKLAAIASLTLAIIGCGGEKPVVETQASKDAAQQAAANWTPEMKANYEKFHSMENAGRTGKDGLK